MARVLGGLMGGFSGKIGGIVGGRWKDIQYARGYVKPSNPDTDGQQYYRARFKSMSLFAIQMLGPVLQEYMDPFVRSMSAFNWFMKHNMPAKLVAWDETLAILTVGTLSPAVITSCTAGSVKIVVAFSTGLGSNGLATDKCFAVARSVTDQSIHVAAAEVARSTGTIDVPFPAVAASNANVWLVTCRRDDADSVTRVGLSSYHVFTHA